MTLRIIITGGTFDKRYDAIRGQLDFKDTHLPDIIEQVRVGVPVELELNQMVDSLDMRDADRQRILDACRNADEERIVITHGTDTMTETAGVIGRAFEAGDPALTGKRIVLTGAMVPYAVSRSDALFNLGSAITASQLVAAGVYIVMNGCCFPWNKVRKNRTLGVFEGEALSSQ
ncbi:asparaginase [Propionivibrio soli]|uniref:asparaginase n=1 Tax=Propionivibrio soli TaxID=2976531 RepID=UPI0021E9412B|nr:asparaginase [Propionivibrio soli]